MLDLGFDSGETSFLLKHDFSISMWAQPWVCLFFGEMSVDELAVNLKRKIKTVTATKDAAALNKPVIMIPVDTSIWPRLIIFESFWVSNHTEFIISDENSNTKQQAQRSFLVKYRKFAINFNKTSHKCFEVILYIANF